jgi:superfamily II DNA helicase RecQ
MKLQFFAVPAISPGQAQEEFNRFVTSHRVARVEKELIADGAASFWSVCVTWIDGEGGTGPVSPPLRRGKEIDYRETLPPAEFVVFDRLRQLRKQIAEVEGLKVYNIFTNEQLAAIVQQRVTTTAALGRIDGVGEGRVTRYGESVLAVMREVVATLTEPAPPAVIP